MIVGITEYAAEEVGDIVFVEFEEQDEVSKGETFGVLETVKAVFDLYAPVSGDVIEHNKSVEENPDLADKIEGEIREKAGLPAPKPRGDEESEG